MVIGDEIPSNDLFEELSNFEYQLKHLDKNILELLREPE